MSEFELTASASQVPDYHIHTAATCDLPTGNFVREQLHSSQPSVVNIRCTGPLLVSHLVRLVIALIIYVRSPPPTCSNRSPTRDVDVQENRG